MYDSLNDLTYKQLILLLLLCKNDDSEEYIKKHYYKKNLKLYNDDLKKMVPYVEYIKQIRDVENPINKKQLKQNKELLPRYYKMKYETFEYIVNDKRITKINLLIILSFIKMYQNTFVREHTVNINQFLFTTLGKKFTFRYKEFLIETLEILKNWSYEDGSVFIKSYKIDGKKLTLEFDKKTKKGYKFV